MRYGLYKPIVMFFGLTNSPATFQTMMNHIFHDVIIDHEKKGTTIRVYMDDIAIGSRKGIEGHCNATSSESQKSTTYISNWRNASSTHQVSITWG